MYVGHFAIGLAIKAANPKQPTLPILLGIGFLDLMAGLFLISGTGIATPDPAAGPYLYFKLVFADWDHSLAMAFFWSVLWGLLFIRNRKLALLAWFAVFSHYLVDLLVHNHDMAVYPYSSAHWGLGLWSKWGIWSWILEGVFAAVLLIYASLKVSKFYMSLKWMAILMIVLFITVSPWFSPMQELDKFTNPKAEELLGIVFLISFTVPAFLMAWLWRKAENNAKAAT
jgi:hypothetical protein